MNRKKQRCPYCGRRMSYISAYFSRRKAEYVCTRCGKESRVVISKLIIPIFIIVAVISLAIIGIWFMLKLLSNPLGIVLVAAPLLIFLAFTPKFVCLEPLKKYQKSMEAKKAGMEYSDNLTASEFDEEINSSLENSQQFKINSDIFNQIKAERSAAKEQAESQDIVSDSEKLEEIKAEEDISDKYDDVDLTDTGSFVKADEKNYVHVINNVSEDHVSTSSIPLKKIHSEGSPVMRSRHYLPPIEEDNEDDPDVYNDKYIADDDTDDDVKNYKKSDNNKYSANRRF